MSFCVCHFQEEKSRHTFVLFRSSFCESKRVSETFAENEAIKLLIRAKRKPFSSITRTMVLGNGLMIIWLDAHIGVTGAYLQFKEQFHAALQPLAAMPPNKINELIHYFEVNVTPIIFVSRPEDALTLIANEKDKRIILISSGSLGQPIIPDIVAQYPRVYFFYIFCGYVIGLRDWALDRDYDKCMKILDFETDLLLHLVRDRSLDVIDLGKAYLAAKDGESARKCFVTAETLEIRANEIDQSVPPVRSRLELLQGPNGLIDQARRL